MYVYSLKDPNIVISLTKATTQDHLASLKPSANDSRSSVTLKKSNNIISKIALVSATPLISGFWLVDLCHLKMWMSFPGFVRTPLKWPVLGIFGLNCTKGNWLNVFFIYYIPLLSLYLSCILVYIHFKPNSHRGNHTYFGEQRMYCFTHFVIQNIKNNLISTKLLIINF